MKKLSKTPVEVFCFDVDSNDSGFRTAIHQQYCKYIKSTCVKPRKSEPYIKVGICSLGSTVAGGTAIHPVIICPQRFKEEIMFETIRKKYLSHWKNIKWVQEVNIGVGGNVDYVAVELNNKGDVNDFLCVEIQAAGTTGTPYPAVQDLINTGRFQSSSYKYGINWANEFTKTMMQQAYKKGKIVQSWKRKIVFVVQDLAMKYLFKTSDCSLVVDGSSPQNPIDFCTFSLQYNGNEWHLQFDAIRSTSIEGVNKILGGADVSEYLTEKEFMDNILRKGISDGVLQYPKHSFFM